MQTKNIVQKKAQDIFLYAAVSIGFLGATEVRGVDFEELYNVVSVESVEKPVEHSITLGNAQSGRLRTRSLNGPTQLGLSVVSDNCLVGYALASSDETTSRYHIKVWLTKESIPIELVVGPVRSAFLPGRLFTRVFPRLALDGCWAGLGCGWPRPGDACDARLGGSGAGRGGCGRPALHALVSDLWTKDDGTRNSRAAQDGPVHFQSTRRTSSAPHSHDSMTSALLGSR